MSINVQNFKSRQHRTALFVDAIRRAKDQEYKERSDRLIQSVNGNNIKVDVFEVEDMTIRPFGSSSAEATTSDANDEDLRAWAASNGYTQVIVSMSASA